MITQIIQAIKEEQRRIADNSVAFNPLSHDDYVMNVGRYRGLQEVLLIIDEILKGDEEV